jgi:uncharacterized protein
MTESAHAYRKPLPVPGPDDRLFWEGCKRHELLLQKCTGCGSLRYWERPMCAQCNTFGGEPVRASGRGTIWSYTTAHHAFSAGWKDELPYTVIVVALDEGPRMTSTLTGGGEPRIGAAVEVVFDDVTPEITLPKFRLRP